MIKKICVVCGKEFMPFRSTQKYCTKDCSSVAQQSKEGYRKKYVCKEPSVHTCAVCGKEFLAKRSDALYCSIKCYHKAVYAYKKKDPTPHVCKQCGNVFLSKRSDALYCCAKCQYLHKRPDKKPHKCPICGTEYMIRSKASACCYACSTLARSIRTMLLVGKDIDTVIKYILKQKESFNA